MHINHAMQSSRRRGVGDILFDSLLGRDSRLLRERSITDSVSDVKNSFSSWDNCMNAVYCKYVPYVGKVREMLMCVGGR
jgi:hypothetical protein